MQSLNLLELQIGSDLIYTVVHKKVKTYFYDKLSQVWTDLIIRYCYIQKSTVEKSWTKITTSP